MTKPSLPQGTRDFGPEIVRKRDFILHTIRSIFEIYGFQPLETPAMENLETLMGKYGEEGDKLIFKILNNGLENPEKESRIREEFEKILKGKNSKGITERALRYDLTIPFARWVAMNHKQLVFPFKRYQVQPVWRADRPQKGRYREFYQCDADVVGSTSLINELEFTHIYAAVFEKLGLDVEIKINNRKVLTALAEITGGADQLTAITVAIDKLDKIGLEKVKEELAQRGLQPQQIHNIENYLSISGNNDQKLNALKSLFADNATGKKGLEELEWLLTSISASYAEPSAGNHPVTSKETRAISITLDPTLARGLNYYTGTIFEVKAIGVKMGSIGGGGRYDDLTGLFGVPDIPGVGISFGVDRIYDVMEELKLFPGEVHSGSQVLFFNLGEKESKAAFGLLQQLRKKGTRAEIFHESSKFEKQFKYAEKKNISFVVILGEEELKTGTCKIKNIKTGLQQEISQDDLVKKFSFI